MKMTSRNKLRGALCFAFALLWLLISIFPVNVFADESSATSTDVSEIVDPEIASPYAIIRNVNTGQVVFEKDAYEKIPPASTVKLMVALLANEMFPDKSEVISASKTALDGVTGNNINIREGEEFTVESLLAAVLISCANDACNVLAENAAGSISEFVNLMNEKAKELGMNDTHYTNPTGLDDDDMYTTAADTAKLAAAVYKVNDLAVLANTAKYVIPETNKSTNVRNLLNKNHLVSTYVTLKYYYGAAVGLNAGYTDNGGHCIVTSSEIDTVAFVYVFMGWQGPSSSPNEVDIEPYSDASSLISWAHKTFTLDTIKATSKMLGEIKVNLGSNVDTVVVRPAEDFDVILDNRKPNEITYETDIDLNDESLVLEAPLEAGTVVGKVNILLDGKVIGTTDLVTMTRVDRNEFEYIMDKIGAFFKSKTLKTIIIVLLVLIGLYIALSITLKILSIVRKIKRRKERKERMKKRREETQRSSHRPRRYDYDDDDDDYYDDEDDDYDY